MAPVAAAAPALEAEAALAAAVAFFACANTGVCTTVATDANATAAARELQRIRSLSPVADAIDRARVIVADEHRAVFQDQEVHRPAEVLVVLDEAGHEGLDLGRAIFLRPRDVNAVPLL